MKLEAEIRAILNGFPVLYLPGLLVGQPIPISGVDHGVVWWLDGDHPHGIPRDLIPTKSGDGIAFMRGSEVRYMIVPVDQADELDRADTIAAINAQGEYFRQEQPKAFLAMVIEALEGAEPGEFPTDER